VKHINLLLEGIHRLSNKKLNTLAIKQQKQQQQENNSRRICTRIKLFLKIYLFLFIY
jgi:hypothetical protein